LSSKKNYLLVILLIATITIGSLSLVCSAQARGTSPEYIVTILSPSANTTYYNNSVALTINVNHNRMFILDSVVCMCYLDGNFCFNTTLMKKSRQEGGHQTFQSPQGLTLNGLTQRNHTLLVHGVCQCTVDFTNWSGQFMFPEYTGIHINTEEFNSENVSFNVDLGQPTETPQQPQSTSTAPSTGEVFTEAEITAAIITLAVALGVAVIILRRKRKQKD
jgi:hypothetical protein